MNPTECDFIHLIGGVRMTKWDNKFLPVEHRNMWFFVVDPVTGREIQVPNPNNEIWVEGLAFRQNMTLEQALQIAKDAIAQKWPSIERVIIKTQNKGERPVILGQSEIGGL